MDPNRRSASPDRRPAQPRRPKELSFYKKSSSSSYAGGAGGGGAVGSFSSRRDPLDRLDDKRRGLAAGAGSGAGAGEDVPGRYGGSRGEYRDRGSSSYSSSRKREEEYQDRDRRRDAPNRGGYGDGSRREDDRDREPRRGVDRKYDEPRSGEYTGGEPLRRVSTRDERDEPSNSAYRGGEELRRVETRNEPPARAPAAAVPVAYGPMIEIIANDRLGRKVRVKCLPSDTVGDLKKLIAAQTGTIASKIQLKKWYTTYKDHITLRDYEIHDGMSLEMY